MKRKIIVISILVITALVLAFHISCSLLVKRTLKKSDEMYNLGCSAVEIVDDFLNDKLTIEKAKEKLERNIEKQFQIYEQEKAESDSDHTKFSEYSGDFLVYAYSCDLLSSINEKIAGTGTVSEIKDAKNDLKDTLKK